MQIVGDPAIIKIFLGSMLAFLPRQYIFCIVPVLLTEATYFIKEIFEVYCSLDNFVLERCFDHLGIFFFIALCLLCFILVLQGQCQHSRREGEAYAR
ncbi:hypothetical protein EON65_16925 [archaeon]|nr:MAG: hypothetical protein EON65_16925 [archaeon]